MTQLHHERIESAAESRLNPLLLTRMRSAAPGFVDRLAAEIQEQVAAYTGPATGRRHRLIARAARGAVQSFLDAAAGKSTSGARANQVFVQMGYGEAVDGHDQRPMQTALRIATRRAWEEIRTLAVDTDASAAALSLLEDLLHAQMRHLGERFAAGYAAGARARASDVAENRAKLLQALLRGEAGGDIDSLAMAAHWEIPDQVVVASMRAAATAGTPDPRTLGEDLLVDLESEPAMIIGAGREFGRVRALATRAHSLIQVAISWPVPPQQAPDAAQISRRALDLAESRVIPSSSVIECAEHSTQLWLHSEPGIRRRLVQELLQPLLGETANTREILSETLLDWLQTRGSAPAIASRLGVHPQTVRYRWKRINELFGESMHDPEFIVQITMVLKASVPMWRAGDHSDMESFLNQEGM